MTPGRGATGLPLTSFARKLICEPRFREIWRVPVLVWESIDEAPADEEDSADAEVLLSVAALTRPRAGEPLVFEVRKAPDSLTAVDGILVGRRSSNDIVIDDYGVSGSHAALRRDEKFGGWTIHDLGSRNGTLVRGERLKPTKRVPLGEDEIVVLGTVTLRFLLPPCFFGYLDRIMTAPPRR